MKSKYKFRNFPCVRHGQILHWVVSGKHPKGSGILEWCLDEFDAKDRKTQMEKDSSFSDLKVEYIP